MKYEHILLDRDEHVAIVTLNHPERLNALNSILGWRFPPLHGNLLYVTHFVPVKVLILLKKILHCSTIAGV